MVSDPYAALDLPHTATPADIKRSYHLLARKHHPDRYVCAPETEKDLATQRFAKIAQAYELLTDVRQKAQYDHIYKYGGYDGSHEEEKKTDFDDATFIPRPKPQQESTDTTDTTSRKRKSTGIGYTCGDPFAFLYTSGKVQSKISHCGVSIPSRLHLKSGGLSFAFGSSQFTQSPTSGKRTYTSTTTRLVNGKKYTTTETTTFYPDGRKEVVWQGDGYTERRFEHVPAEHLSHSNSMNQPEPWYIGAWHGIKDRLTMCYSPCTVAN
ncbi:hypothetical protein MPSEU_000313000 [Mayamaea pseudoterrestris]|nr:hypothetical protein MPSEU_000313000 [Mayamaea pseudoterrestris]